MNVRPLALGDLPRVAATDVEASRAWAAWLARSPKRERLTLPGLGSFDVSVRGLRAPGGGRRVGLRTSVALVGEVGPGACEIEAWSAMAWIARVIGAPPPSVLRTPATLERGILAAVVSAVLGALGVPAGVTLDEPKGSWARPALELAVDVAGAPGFAWVDLPVPLAIARRPFAPWALVALLERAAVPVVVERAHTSLTHAQRASLARGDVVVCAGTPHAQGAETADAVARVGEHAAPAQLRANDLALHLTGPFCYAPRSPGPSTERPTMTGRDPSTPTTVPDVGLSGIDAKVAPEAETAAEILASSSIDVAVEVGRVLLSGQELAGLVNGAVLALGGGRSSLVATLTVGGRAFARGELVEADGELGVRIVEVLGAG